jgi:hypothetical protein
MATLTAGEKARMYALGKIMRGGASRGGYVSSAVYIAIDGVQMASRVLLNSLTITDELDETPNTCAFRVKDTVPAAGAEVVITLGSKNRAGRLYAGFALTVAQLYVGDKPANVQADVRCVDYTWQFGFLLVTQQYRTQSATAIARDLVSRYAAANGFTSGAVAPNLPILDEITYTNEPLDTALTRLARRIGGYWYVDYLKSVHLFLEDATNAPEPLTPTHKSLRAFQKSADRTQVLTRVYVEGRGSTTLAGVAPGASMVPLESVDMFAAGYDVFVKVAPQGSAGGAQFLTFAGVVDGGAGALVGSGTAPSAMPVLTPTSGGAVTVGPHYYCYTWVSAAGETVSSPGALVTITSSAPSAIAPGTKVSVGAGLPPGGYFYGVTHVLASGETAVSGDGAASCTRFLGTSSVAPGLRAWPSLSTNLGAIGHQMEARLAYRSTTSLSPATLGPISGRVTLVASTTGQPSGLEVSFNLSLPMSANYLDVQVRNVTTGGAWGTVQTYSNVGGGGISAGCYVGVVSPTTAATETGGLDTASVTITVKDGGADVISRKVYRSKMGGGQKYFLRSVSGSAQTSFVDTAADSTLVTPPPTAMGALQTVTVSGIATGPHTGGGGGGTTARKLYRTRNDGATWGLLTTIADNTTTTFVDTVADAALTGGGAPTSDTSGLVADNGQVLAGAPTIPVSGTGAFPATGGWVLSGNNRIHYAGVGAATLTGVPASGDGAILNTIPYGSPITLAPMLTQVGGIGTPLSAGDELYLVVFLDDAARQSALSDMVNGGPGMREEWVQDRRLSIAEARARAQATLAMRPLEAVTISYVCRDLRTAAGKTITVNLPAPTNVFGTYKIQSVTITNFRPHPTQYPTYTVTASSRRFNFEDWLRRIETSV